ncbi:MAG: SDR family oxidoreductase [Blastomonas sp.]
MGDAGAPLALVTGGVRRLGAAIAARLARSGYALALHGHHDTEPDVGLAKVLKDHATQWAGLAADLSDPAAPADLIDRVIAQFGRAPDLLVNNASLFRYDDWTDMTAAGLAEHMQVNALSPVMLARELEARAGPDQQPAIVHIVDQRVRNPNGDQLSYTLAKQALAESIRTLARAFGARARINGVAPGLTIATADYDDAQMERLAGRMPLGRLSAPDEIADAVLYLADAKSVTGQMVFVDGGAHMIGFERDFLFMER